MLHKITQCSELFYELRLFHITSTKDLKNYKKGNVKSDLEIYKLLKSL